MITDLYFKKEIIYPFSGEKFVFAVAETLFSTFDIDHGTDILAKKYPKAKVIMVDKDLLAIRYSKINLEKNYINNASVLGSVGMEAVSGQEFDLIVSNIPAKIGDQAIAQDFVLTPCQHLNLNGELWVVVVNALNRLIPKLGGQYNLNIKDMKKRNGHTVYRIKKNS